MRRPIPVKSFFCSFRDFFHFPRTCYEERGPAVTERSKCQRTWRMIRQLRNLGYQVELLSPQAVAL